MKKTWIAYCLLAAAAGAQAMAQVEAPGPLRKTSAVVVSAGGSAAVRVDGQLVTLAGAIVYDAKGARLSPASLVPGKPITFTIAAEGTQRIKEVWTTD